jgi:GTP-binding protein Era
MNTYCGYIALIGRPNVGKSTLMNRLIKQKISITSRKPQTTRHRVLGIHTKDNYQFIYVDTPGIHREEHQAMNKMMNQTAKRVLDDVDVAVMIMDAHHWQPEDEDILTLVKQTSKPTILVINKVDRIKDKENLLPLIQTMQEKHTFTAIIPLSARTGVQVDNLENQLQQFLPASPHFFAADQVTDRSTKFICSEIMREKVFRFCGQELPYATSVEIESFKEDDKLITMHVLIIVDKENHKRMLIGNKGEKMKEMATQARLDMQRLLDKKIMLKCWVKVKSGWADNIRMLRQLGYDQ